MEYCWSMLPKVSRSFALCMPELPNDIKDIACVSYNLCRIIDTIEDSRERSIEIKRKQMDHLEKIIRMEKIDNSSGLIESIVKETRNENEANLVGNIERVLDAFSGFSLETKDSIKRWIFEMMDGMKEFLSREIKTFNDQNKYCYYVAGTVGRMLTEIYRLNNHLTLREFKTLLNLANDFGLGLQKTNIIKNIKVDFEEGRRYWPYELFDRIDYEDLFKKERLDDSLKISNKLVEDAQYYLEKGLRYTLLVPENEIGIRTFCCIPLFMAVATLSRCYNNPSILLSRDDVKITKDQVDEILVKSKEYSEDNFKIKDYFNQLMEF